MNPILWQPSPQRIEAANLTRFMARVRADQGTDVFDFASLYQWSIDFPEAFWSTFWDFSSVIAKKKGNDILIGGEKMLGVKWFPQARLNYAENLLKKRNDNECAIIFWGEDRQKRNLTYGELYSCVSRVAQSLRRDGLNPGDRVAGVLPNMPEAIIAMLATASIGAVWTSCSPDFGVQGIIDRFGQIEPKLLFICDGYFFNGKVFDTSKLINRVVNAIPSIKKAIMVSYIQSHQASENSVITGWDDYVANFSGNMPIEFEQVSFGHPLFILYSSGTTGVPKCIVHSVGGTLLQHLKEHLLHVDIHPKDRLFYFSTCGWMMWNWLVSALASAATLVLYDGSPIYPSSTTLFDMVDETQVNIFGVSAKYIDRIKKSGCVPFQSHDLSSLKTILSTGSPLVAESFDFVYHSVKSNVCLSSISGGTDIISCFVLGCPILPVRRGEIQCRGLAMKVEVLDENGLSVRQEKGELVCLAPFPSMPVGFWNDPDQQQYRAAYFEKYPGVWCHGDYVELSEHDGLIIHGRSDAILNPGGVRIGTTEIYRPVEQIDEVVDSLVIGQEWKGDCRVILFVMLRQDVVLTEALTEKIKKQIKAHSSPRHIPAKIIQVSDIPRTKSGKTVELAVRDIVHGRAIRNKEALANPESLDQFLNITELKY